MNCIDLKVRTFICKCSHLSFGNPSNYSTPGQIVDRSGGDGEGRGHGVEFEFKAESLE